MMVRRILSDCVDSSQISLLRIPNKIAIEPTHASVPTEGPNNFFYVTEKLRLSTVKTVDFWSHLTIGYPLE
jgi:hypothetical protein